MEENGNDTIIITDDKVIENNNNTTAAVSTAICEDCKTLDEEGLEENEVIDESDTQEDEVNESDDEATAADKPCTPPPPPPKQGSCVGVLYKSSKKNQESTFCKQSGSKYYCVHNGKLVGQGDGYILVNHWFVDQTTGTPKEETRKFWKNKCPQYFDIKTTPDGGCPNNRKPKPNKIIPGQCIGIEISGANTPTGKDMKNGRYKNWVDTSDKPHCYLPISLPSNLKYIYYFHYPKSQAV